MKFTTPLMALGLAAGVVAKPATLAQRGIQDFLGIISGINDAVDNLTPLVEGYNGGDATDLLASGDAIVDMINDGVETANAQDELTILEGAQLTQPVLNLIKDTEALIGLLVDRKDLAVENDIASDIKANLNAQYEAANALAEAISAKMPAAMKDIAKDLADKISAAIKTGVDAYADVPDAEEPKPTESEGPAPTEEPEPTETEGPAPTEDPEVPEPTEEPEVPEPTDCVDATSTVTVTVTDCGPGAPQPTLPVPVPPVPTGTASWPVPQPPAPTSTGKPTPPEFDSGASLNKVGSVGALAALAVVLAF